VFFAHGFNLYLRGEDFPLVDEAFVAADEGPIVPSLNHALRDCGVTPCGRLKDERGEDILGVPHNAPEFRAVKLAWDAFKDTTSDLADKLVRVQNWAWVKAWTTSKNSAIPTEGIANYFRESMKRAMQAREQEAREQEALEAV
jgi:uncharacterized phage-associated protein